MAKKYWGLKVEDAELQSWKDAAVVEGRLLSEWVRDKLNTAAMETYVAGAFNADPVPPISAPIVGLGKAPVPESFTAIGHSTVADDLEIPKPHMSECQHGTARGYRCWQCGGIAKA